MLSTRWSVACAPVHPRDADDERHADRLLVRPDFPPRRCSPQRNPLSLSVDDDRVVERPAPLQRLHDVADLPVDVAERRELAALDVAVEEVHRLRA